MKDQQEFHFTYNLVDVVHRRIQPATITVRDGIISRIEPAESAQATHFVMPGFIDAHVHVESSMLLPSEFARTAVVHGTVATISDPHEIANVCGIDGIELMLRNAAQSPFKFCFGAPSCVPATEFETAGARLDTPAVSRLLADKRIGYLSEVMDFPGVLRREAEVMAKIEAAKSQEKPVDGHAPGLKGDEARQYISAGITTDHECYTAEEAIDKIRAGCMISIREGSAARNFDALQMLIDQFPDQCMLCSDDKHPDELLEGHINQLVARAIASGRDLMNVLQVACLNPVKHYGLNVGRLQIGDPADFIVVKDLANFEVLETYINGQVVARDGQCLLPQIPAETINQFGAIAIETDQLKVPAQSKRIRVIEAVDGQLITKSRIKEASIRDGLAIADPDRDLLKLVVLNRYQIAQPAIGFVHGFGLKSGALASSVAHDSHNIVAAGTNDEDLTEAINAIVDQGGGLSVSASTDTQILPLSVAGLMSTGSCQEVGVQYARLDRTVKEFGCQLRAPFMTLAFMALLVIPSLKLSDLGLFDVEQFQFVSLFVD